MIHMETKQSQLVFFVPADEILCPSTKKEHIFRFATNLSVFGVSGVSKMTTDAFFVGGIAFFTASTELTRRPNLKKMRGCPG